MKNLLLILTSVVVIVAGCSESPNSIAPVSSTDHTSSTQSFAKLTMSAVVPNSYIVVLSSKLPEIERTTAIDRLSNLEKKISELTGQYTIEVIQKWESCFTGFAAIMDSRVADALSHDPRIESIEADQYAYAYTQTLPTGINRIDGDVSSTISGNGSGTVGNVEIYIIDTGIQTNHPDLNVVGGINYAGGSSSNYNDGNGHGTHVAGTAAAKDNTSYVVGVAPAANLFAVRVLNNQGSGQFSWIISGVNWVTSRKSGNTKGMVANMSLGAYAGTTGYNSLDNAIANSISAGITYAIAAGNSSGDASLYTPAHVTSALTVGAYSPTSNAWASFSNYGSIVDILAPGVNILSTYKNSSTATLSGTSMASPHVTGTVALYLSGNPSASPTTVRTALINAANSHIPVNPGSGSPNSNASVTGVPSGTTTLSVYAGSF